MASRHGACRRRRACALQATCHMLLARVVRQTIHIAHARIQPPDVISPCAQTNLEQLRQLLLQLLPLLARAHTLPHVALEGAVQVQQALI